MGIGIVFILWSIYFLHRTKSKTPSTEFPGLSTETKSLALPQMGHHGFYFYQDVGNRSPGSGQGVFMCSNFIHKRKWYRGGNWHLLPVAMHINKDFAKSLHLTLLQTTYKLC